MLVGNCSGLDGVAISLSVVYDGWGGNQPISAGVHCKHPPIPYEKLGIPPSAVVHENVLNERELCLFLFEQAFFCLTYDGWV